MVARGHGLRATHIKIYGRVDRSLTAGGIRELHWHTAAEWAIMLYGGARITAIDDEGRSFVRDKLRAISGTFRRAYPIPSNDSRLAAPRSCWWSLVAPLPTFELWFVSALWASHT